MADRSVEAKTSKQNATPGATFSGEGSVGFSAEPSRPRELPSNPLVAFQGEVEVLNATWSLDGGRRVEFRLCGESFERQHPFKKFQQKRNGHVGTRFKASLARISTGECVGMMELMLCSWKDSSSVGQAVQFWIDDEAGVHPFCGCAYRKGQQPGEMFCLILVELGDDEQPVDQVRRDKVEDGARQAMPGRGVAGQGSPGRGEARHGEPGTAPTSKAKKLSSAAHLLLVSPMFTQYLKETKPNLVKSWTPEVARRYAKGLIGVESLSDLDRDRAAVERFQNLVRRPYDRWAHQDPR